ncbi:MAG: alpha-hydroxy acid oxidase, partial [Solirubrobacterales bacterium]
ATIGPRELSDAAPPAPRWFQLYRTRVPEVSETLVASAVEGGFEAIVLTVDAPRPGLRERDLHTGFTVPPGVDMPAVSAALGRSEGVTVEEFFSIVDPSLTWEGFAAMAQGSPLPIILKGILTAEDAALACENGAAGIIVSNHGGRQLDGVQATAHALPEVVAAVDGRVEVFVDGGVRRGRDILVALALGARAVLVGRPVLWGLAVGGRDGALAVLDRLASEFAIDLALLGCRDPSEVTAGHVGPAGLPAQA